MINLQAAFETHSLRTFMAIVFPPHWASIAARIEESGASMSPTMVPWAPRWTKISPTVRTGPTDDITAVKSLLYRAHDCLHQLWGLPIPGPDLNEDDFFLYKRAQMCGEVAVLTLTEFVLAASIADREPELRSYLNTRNALPLLDGPLRGRSTAQIAARLDDLLHKQRRPRWVRDSPTATAFVNDYVPMLEEDRRMIDHNWKLMREKKWYPAAAPNARYNQEMDGLELTMWMIDDFYHLIDTDPVVDEELADFNRERRFSVQLPAGWNETQPYDPRLAATVP